MNINYYYLSVKTSLSYLPNFALKYTMVTFEIPYFFAKIRYCGCFILSVLCIIINYYLFIICSVKWIRNNQFLITSCI